ncbi:2,3-diaminopropionate biosynthesis protein SbnB [Paenibacillaceae bacterium]|nr:2,3-diaminopropionate biosynthesis protein SbnB [Paenibacillaceae bacterium]
MLYLGNQQFDRLGIDWNALIDVIEDAVRIMQSGDYDQPLKPYLRYRNPRNRIIAMPAYVGGAVNTAGLKWVASFPGNLEKGLPRAHSLTVLNEAGTGKPLAVLNTARVSGVRTAAVSGAVLRRYAEVRPLSGLKVGIAGFGPIGQLHLQMLTAQLGDAVAEVALFDPRGIDIASVPEPIRGRTTVAEGWESAYAGADIFVTCTVSEQGYIDQRPKGGALLLNVSLRDFTPAILDYTRAIIVDDWDEVCREGTDIERMHKERQLSKADTISLGEVVCDNAISQLSLDEAVLFNPMGMAVFDIAIAAYYYEQAVANKAGLLLPE